VIRCATALLALLTLGPPASAGGDAAEPVDLLADGLDAWAYSDDTQADAWTLEDGVLRTTGKPNGYIRTKANYDSFVLELDILHEKRGNSGVLLRGTGPDKVWPKSIEAQGMKDNLGDIFLIGGFKADAGDRLKGRRIPKLHETNEKPVGEWNHYAITLDGDALELRVNGEPQNKVAGVERGPGFIGLQSEGVPVRFKNLKLTPIKRDSAERASARVPEDQPIVLFNGTDLTGWSGKPEFWRVEDGAIVGQTTRDKKTKGNTFLIYTGDESLDTPPTFGDFELTFEWKLEGKNNSGVQYRGQHRGNFVVGGYQYDIQNNVDQHAKLYDEKGRGRIAMPLERVTMTEAGEKRVTGNTVEDSALKAAFKHGDRWNAGRIVARGHVLLHDVNGVLCIELKDEDDKAREMTGIIALQLHAGAPMTVRFRNIRLRDLSIETAD